MERRPLLASLTVTSSTLTVTAGQAYNGTLATVSDPSPPSGGFEVGISWSTGGPSNYQWISGTSYDFTGPHTYMTPGT
jgi:hypothetical protein